MSPTLGFGTAGHGTNVYGSTQTSGNAQPGGTGFEPSATGGVLEGAGQYEQTRSSGEASQVPTTTEGGILGAQGAHVPVQTPGGSSGLEASTGRLGTVSSDALPGGIVDAGDSHVEGFVTPRSQHGLQHQGLPTITEMVEGFPASGRQLMTRVGEFFRVARTEVMQVPTVWQDTHVTPPRSTSQSHGSLGAAPGHLALGEGSMGSHSSLPPQVGMPGTPTSFAPHPGRDSSSLLSPDVLQRMQALEQRAPLLYGYPPERPSSRSNSSSIPQEAIQAEVARQLASFDQRAQVQELEIQRLKRQLEDANQAAQRERAIREQVEREATLQRNVPQVAPNPAPQQPPVLEQAATPQVVQVLPQDAQVPVPITHQVQDVAAQAVEASRAPAQSAASAIPGLLSNLWSGFGGLRDITPNPPPGRVGHSQPSYGSTLPSTPPGRDGNVPSTQPTQVPRSEVPQASGSGEQDRNTSGGVPTHATPAASSNSVLDAVLAGMQQLQSLQAQALRDKRDDKPEVVKPGVTTLPKLTSPDPAGGSLEFQDWLDLVGGLMHDLSDTSQLWWSSVMQLAKDAYAQWSVSSPLDRLKISPDERPEITTGQWARVNARACAMLLDSLETSVKADIVARRATQNAAHIMFRLHTMYQPGGASERNLVQKNLQDPPLIKDVVSGVTLLRAWGRWYRRCLECGMAVPDTSILARGLTNMSSSIIGKHQDVLFRTQCERSALHIDLHPSGEEVLDYHKHFLAEFETLAGAIDVKKTDAPNPKLQAIDPAGGTGSQPSGKDQGNGGKGGGKSNKCKYFLSPKGCKYGAACKNTHSLNELSKAERFKKCLNCGSEDHRVADCKATKKPDRKPQEPKATPQVAQVSQPVPSTSQSQPIVQATPIMSMDSFLQQASHALRQLEAVQATQGVSSGATAPATSTLPVNPTPEGGGQQQPPSSQPSIKRLAITSIMPASCFGSQNPGSPTPPLEASDQGLGMAPNDEDV